MKKSSVLALFAKVVNSHVPFKSETGPTEVQVISTDNISLAVKWGEVTITYMGELELEREIGSEKRIYIQTVV